MFVYTSPGSGCEVSNLIRFASGSPVAIAVTPLPLTVADDKVTAADTSPAVESGRGAIPARVTPLMTFEAPFSMDALETLALTGTVERTAGFKPLSTRTAVALLFEGSTRLLMGEALMGVPTPPAAINLAFGGVLGRM